MIEYCSSLENRSDEDFEGFFEGWPNPPSLQKRMKILQNSDYIWLAADSTTGKIIGFINAISDKTLCAYIPLLEVLPEYRGQGIGSELVRLMLNTLSDYYMVDLICDEKLSGFYSRFNMFEGKGMMIRNYRMQCGK
mgnify:CR=1 FL=1